MRQPDLSLVPPFYHNYIRLVQGNDLQQLFRQHRQTLVPFLEAIPKDKWDYRYAEGKWTIKEVVQHMIDAERIFCYRALRFARKDETPLAGFDEQTYAAASKADRRTRESLLEEIKSVQEASAHLFLSFDEEQLSLSGTANGNRIDVRAIAFILLGHTMHHQNILKERYL